MPRKSSVERQAYEVCSISVLYSRALRSPIHTTIWAMIASSVILVCFNEHREVVDMKSPLLLNAQLNMTARLRLTRYGSAGQTKTGRTRCFTTGRELRSVVALTHVVCSTIFFKKGFFIFATNGS